MAYRLAHLANVIQLMKAMISGWQAKIESTPHVTVYLPLLLTSEEYTASSSVVIMVDGSDYGSTTW